MPNEIKKSAEEIALLLTMRKARTAKGKAVQAKVLAAVEIEIMCADICRNR